MTSRMYRQLGVLGIVWLSLLGSSRPSLAQGEEAAPNQSAEAPPPQAFEAPAPAVDAAEPAATESSPPQLAAQRDGPPIAVDNTQAFAASAHDSLELHGGMELDLGYAAYRFEVPSDPSETFNDARGRFVFGPVAEHDFGHGYYLRGVGQVVAWLREELGKYQVNVDDVYARAGKHDGWDVQLGRFETWTAYHKGLGFDYYTLEDGGALKTPPQNSGLYGVYKYEVNFIYRRETPARVALHLYPTPWLGFEAAAAYGKDQLLNTLGGRAVADLKLPFLRISLGAEYKTYTPAQEASTLDAAGVKIVCDKCADRFQYGAGGSAVANLSIFEAGGGVARGKQQSYSQKDGTPDLPGSAQRTTFGGYAQVDLGKPLLGRSLIVGGGAHVTESVVDNGDFERHIQSAAYAAYPLGFNNAMLKLVVSDASLLVLEDTGDGVTFTSRTNHMRAARLRFSYVF